jgi:hypothetical protein
MAEFGDLCHVISSQSAVNNWEKIGVGIAIGMAIGIAISIGFCQESGICVS